LNSFAISSVVHPAVNRKAISPSTSFEAGVSFA
jgi:hypothetical protein